MADSNSLNEFTFLGFVGKDPELIQCKDPSRKFCIIDIATQEKYKGRDKPRVTWHQVQLWGTQLAPWAVNMVKKGMQIVVKGKVSTREFKYWDQDGREHIKKIPEFKGETFTILRQKKIIESKESAPPEQAKQQDPY